MNNMFMKILLEETSTQTIWTFGSTQFTDGFLFFLLRSIIAMASARVAVVLVRRAVEAAITKDIRKMQLHYLFQIFRVMIHAVAVFYVLSNVRLFSTFSKAVLGATSVISVILGLAAQEAFGNFISGFFLTLNQPFTTGDLISIPSSGITGRVQGITLRHTILLTYEGTKVIVPNSTMNSAVIEDCDYGQTSYNVLIKLSVAYESDFDLVRRTILETAAAVPGILDLRTDEERAAGQPLFVVRFSDFLDSGVEVSFRIPVKNYDESFVITSNLREALLNNFRTRGIEIPYNKLQITNFHYNESR